MTGRIVTDRSKCCVAQPFIECSHLETVGIQPGAAAATLHGLLFRLHHEPAAKAGAAQSLRDEQQIFMKEEESFTQI